MSGSVHVERTGRIAHVRIDRGDGVNALSDAVMRELTDVARSFEDDAETSAVVLTGSSSVFSLGFDLTDRSTAELASAGLAHQRVLQRRGPRLCDAWEAIEPLTIVAIEGWCVGGGVALAVSCDLRVMARDARVYVPEIERGMNMSWGSIPRFVNLMGPARTKRLVALAEKIDADTAHRWGFADEVAEPGGAVARATALAERAAALPPVQLRMCKQGIDAAAKALNQAVSSLDRDQFLLAQRSEDFGEGVASFLEKRPPRYTGR
jgi:enoyl-CoA hydratase/carnithine racemase